MLAFAFNKESFEISFSFPDKIDSFVHLSAEKSCLFWRWLEILHINFVSKGNMKKSVGLKFSKLSGKDFSVRKNKIVYKWD